MCAQPRLVRLPNAAALSSLVTAVLGLNPGKMTLQGSNIYLVGAGKRRILVDSGQGVPEFLPLLRTVLTSNDASISDILITHRHHDHIGGIAQALQTTTDHAPIRVWKRITPRDTAPTTAREFAYHSIEDNQLFVTEGATLRALHTPGHCDDHVVFFLEEENALFSGDCVLGQGSTTFEDLKEYMDSLQRTLDTFPFINRIYPGHGPDLSNGREVVRQYIQHRLDRENEIIKVLGEAENQQTARQIVEIIYALYPQTLWASAEYSVRQHLKKLQQEGRVKEVFLHDKFLYALL
ncbi:putative metallo-beta-lactamase domain protein [Chytriomyces sp. MP71]|nr:putative metallo-beta-lactamase domain protein [Chytriomyces sp. MP71]